MFRAQDFDSLTIKVMSKELPPINHPFFSKHKCFQEQIEGIDMNVLIRYIVLFYDPKSPLLDKFSDHLERKKCAATLAGWKPNKEYKFSKQVETILYCQNRESNECIIEYLRNLKNPDWAYLCSSWEAYFQVLLELMSEAVALGGKAGTKTSVDVAASRAILSEKASKMAQDLSDRTIKFLSQDESPYLKSYIFDMIETKRKLPIITPERISFGME